MIALASAFMHWFCEPWLIVSAWHRFLTRVNGIPKPCFCNKLVIRMKAKLELVSRSSFVLCKMLQQSCSIFQQISMLSWKILYNSIFSSPSSSSSLSSNNLHWHVDIWAPIVHQSFQNFFYKLWMFHDYSNTFLLSCVISVKQSKKFFQKKRNQNYTYTIFYLQYRWRSIVESVSPLGTSQSEPLLCKIYCDGIFIFKENIKTTTDLEINSG